ncbi:MAG: SAM-dependent methyltransferase [Alphaproteobacteria bacterium]|nr:SAM-dependent methyltransferase [Alphaproteobacteria bacterium]
MNELAITGKITDIISEYEYKMENATQALTAFKEAGENLKVAATIRGTWGNTHIDTGHVYESSIISSIKKSAWQHLYKLLHMDRLASARDKRIIEQEMQDPPEFTMENIRATYGDFVRDPWGNILRSLAEVFCDLDPAYKSHSKVKIGVKGLPKRIILKSVGAYGSWGNDRLENVLNALAAYQSKPLVTRQELMDLMKDEDALKESRGVKLVRYKNGNGHLIFHPDTLNDINKALAEYYGEVLPDCEDKDIDKQGSTAVAKDLQYYPTPEPVVQRVIRDLPNIQGKKILEPSCGCGRFMDALSELGANVVGIEVDPTRAGICREKGHSVLVKNFLETQPTESYDYVIMNPPFYGKHYAKHIEHAYKFVKPGGRLIAALPATARYDHGLVDGRWEDLPVGSFRKSGTNINTTILTKWKRD